MGDNRQCYACGNHETYITKDGRRNWYLNRDTQKNVICATCYKEIWYHPIWDKRRLVYKGKRIYLNKEPRVGMCSECGRKGYTHIHHDKYDDKNPLAHTKELCPKCHTKKTHELKQYKTPIELRPRDYHGRFT